MLLFQILNQKKLLIRIKINQLKKNQKHLVDLQKIKNKKIILWLINRIMMKAKIRRKNKK